MNLDISFDPKLAEICGIHAGDGYLRGSGKRWELDISGNVEEKDYYDNHVIPLFEDVFKIRIIGKLFPHRNTYGFVIRDRDVIRFMNKIGFPYGSKSLSVKIPQFVFKNKKLMCSFLRGYFDTDGCLSFGKKYGNCILFKKIHHTYPRISFSTVSESLAKDINILFNKLNFRFLSYTYQPKVENENLKYRFDINGVTGLNLWLDQVGIKNNMKNSRFLIWKKYGVCPPKLSYTQMLKILDGSLNPELMYKKGL